VIVDSGGASLTAVLVCQGRAAAHGRLAVDRFSDPIAERLLREDELVPVRAVRACGDDVAIRTAGAAARMRVESVRAVAQVVVARTVVIDEAVTTAVTAVTGAQVVLVGAGLDTRPWRLASLGDATVFSVDHPASQADARDRAAGLVPVARQLVFVPADLTTSELGPALASVGHDRAAPTVWVWEGVVPYLARSDVEATVSVLKERSAPGSVLVVNYQTPSLVATIGRRVAILIGRLLKVEPFTGDEPWRSLWTPPDMARLLAQHGFITQQDDDLLHVAQNIGSPTGQSHSLLNGRVASARFGS
jgi:methyltransferase (TIGR00027 family)